MPNTPFSQIERTWFASRASLPSIGVPYTTDDLKYAYWSRGSVPSVGMKGLNEIESDWWDVITAGASKRTGNRADVIAQALSIYSSAAVSRINNENEYLFYSTVTISSLK